jgi:hypothetical protein
MARASAAVRKRAAAPRFETEARVITPAVRVDGHHTPAEIAEARVLHLRWLATVSKWLRVDEAKVRHDDRKLVDRVMATVGGDGTAFEKALGYPPVDQLFARGVLRFQPPT